MHARAAWLAAPSMLAARAMRADRMQRPRSENLAIVALVVSCGNGNPPGTIPSATSVGAPCVPAAELSASFAGFDYHDVTLDEDNAACSGTVCLVNHFQGLTGCPYGQDSNGNPPPPITSGCTVPGTSTPVRPNGTEAGQSINPQCLNRVASLTVYCSCRCADAEGNTGTSYCTCPSGYDCTQVVPATQEGAGGYCIQSGTAYAESANVCAETCDAVLMNCPIEPRD